MRRARIGELDQRVALEQPVDAPDGLGGATRTWVLVADVWAKLTCVSGDRSIAGEREESVLTHRVLIRWRPDISASMRLRVGSRILAIHAALDWDTRRRFLLLQCEETA